MRVLSVEELKLQDSTAAIELYSKKKQVNVPIGDDLYRITGISFSGIATHFKYSIKLKQCSGTGRITLAGDCNGITVFSLHKERSRADAEKADKQKPILQTTAKLPERKGKPYAADLFKRELCRGIQRLSLPESMSMPAEIHMIIKLPGTTISETMVRTSRGWIPEKYAQD
ncbi:hypothetical protein [Hydrogenoanaerobacterium sp.]|uniref:hypothetical protein n=1 Tax=Hydrogenoanaerobacterium sp. TaxID=2953763 RepID=UPI00289C0694|nr:hypothetical protein [Hydrogenoanaerobacterium sp.]